ncbi:hypothetical protein Tco_0769217 [Tanacetum coccineum]|uniref:F-box domain-containing protein n=1 Tax=Tanacetum coccineum TaxID=301880 RepID=A0ABQ4ZBF1_9ASTR
MIMVGVEGTIYKIGKRSQDNGRRYRLSSQHPVSVIPNHTRPITSNSHNCFVNNYFFSHVSLFLTLTLTTILHQQQPKHNFNDLVVPGSKTLFVLHQRETDLEKDVKELNIVDHSVALLSTIKYEVLNAVKEYLGTSLDDALHKVLQKHSADITKEHYVPAEIVKRLRQQYVPEKTQKTSQKARWGMQESSKCLNPKQRALYHALMGSILEDEDAMDEEKPPLTFDELMSTPIDFLAYVMNNLKIDNLTQDLLVGPSFNLLKATCKSHMELEYN